MAVRVQAADRQAARFGAELARLRLNLTAAEVIASLEAKAGFDPDQPRVPHGRRTGGQWVSLAAEHLREAGRIFRDAVGHATGEVLAFLILNQESIIRTLGALQAAGGATEASVGFSLAQQGARSPFLGPVVAALGSWMVVNGFDNFDAGWRTLTTGQSHETNLHRILTGWGLSDGQANLVELLLGGGTAVGAARSSHAAFARQVQAGLAARTLAPFTARPLTVRSNGRSLWEARDIQEAGEAWERFDAARTGYRLTSRTFPGVDQISADGRVVISNKTLNTRLSSYQANDRALFERLGRYIRQLAAFPPTHLSHLQPRERRLHLLLPAGEAAPGQALQLAAAEAYASARGIILTVEYAR